MLSRLMTRREQLLLIAVAGAICLGAGTLVFYRLSRPDAPQVVSQVEKATAKPKAAPPSAPQPQPSPLEAEPAASPTPALAAIPAPGPPDAAPAPPPAEAKREVAISLMGAVQRPGVYVLEEGARVKDLVEKGGGLLDDADTGDINLAARLVDGTTLTIPVSGRAVNDKGTLIMRGGQSAADLNIPQYTVQGWTPERSTPQPAAATSAPPAATATAVAPAVAIAGGIIDVNTATEEQLQELPGIGPKLAHEIVAYRSQNRFATVEDLNNVPGIGPKRLDAVRNLVTVR